VWPRIVDLRTALSAVTGKIELVHEGEEQGAESVARHVLGKAVREVFQRRFPPVHAKSKRRRAIEAEDETSPAEAPAARAYEPIVQWFSSGSGLQLSDDSTFAAHVAALRSVEGLEACARAHASPADDGELAGAMELVLDGLHQCSMLAKEDADRGVGYRDMIGAMFRQMEGID
jgi:magnesium chelatase subunit I